MGFGLTARSRKRLPAHAENERRVGLLRGAGNAIVPQAAAVFIKAFMESVGIVDG